MRPLQLQFLQCQWKKKDPAPNGVHSENETTQSFTSTPGLYQVRQATAPWEGDCKGQRKSRKDSALNSGQGPASHPVCAHTQPCAQPHYGATPLPEQGCPTLSSSEGKERCALAGSTVTLQHTAPSSSRHPNSVQLARGTSLADRHLDALPASEACSRVKKQTQSLLWQPVHSQQLWIHHSGPHEVVPAQELKHSFSHPRNKPGCVYHNDRTSPTLFLLAISWQHFAR